MSENEYTGGNVDAAIAAIEAGKKKIAINLWVKPGWIRYEAVDPNKLDTFLKKLANSDVTHIQVSSLGRNYNGLKKLLSALSEKRSTVSHLSFSSEWDGRIKAESGKILCDALPQSQLTSLDLNFYGELARFSEFSKRIQAAIPQSRITNIDISTDIEKGEGSGAYNIEGSHEVAAREERAKELRNDIKDAVAQNKKRIEAEKQQRIKRQARKKQEQKAAAEEKALKQAEARHTALVSTREQTLALLQPDARMEIDGAPVGTLEKLTYLQTLGSNLVSEFDDVLRDFDRELNRLIAEHATTAQAREAAQARLDAAPERNAALDKDIQRHKLNIVYGRQTWEAESEAYAAGKKTEKRRGQLVKVGVNTALAAGSALLSAVFPPAAYASAAFAALAADDAVGAIGASVEGKYAVQTRKDTYKARHDAKTEHDNAIIKLLEAEKVDITGLEGEISDLSAKLKQLIESKEVMALHQDEKAMERLAYGLLIQRVVERGFGNTQHIEKRLIPNSPFDSADAWLDALKQEDERVYEAVARFTLGHANSSDLHVMIEEGNAVSEGASDAYQLLHALVEKRIKPDIDHFFSRGSMIDMIEELGLMDSEQMRLNMSPDSGKNDVAAKLDQQTRLAMMGMFADQTGVTHVGNYDLQRLFSFYLHRHGNTELRDTMIEDGRISYSGKNFADKCVSVLPEGEAGKFTERFKTAYARRDGQQPKIGDLFLRICAYEYYLPQAVRSGTSGNDFNENPEAPIGITMADRVINEFVHKMADGGIDEYRQKIGDKLDTLIAQSFIDFFAEIGKKHNTQFKEEREELRRAHYHDDAGPAFTDMEEAIVEDAVEQFDQFLEIYTHNLEKTLQIMPQKDIADMKAQIEQVAELAEGALAPAIVEPGSTEARERARATSAQRFINMTESPTSSRGVA